MDFRRIIGIVIMVFTICLNAQNTEAYKSWEEHIIKVQEYLAVSSFDLAKEHIIEAEKLAEDALVGLPFGFVNMYYFYGIIETKLGLYESAKNQFVKSLEFHKNVQEPDLQHQFGTRLEIANLEAILGDSDKAIADVKEILIDYKENLDSNSEVYAAYINNLGELYYSTGDCKGALKYYNQALQYLIDLKIRSQTTSQVYYNIAVCNFVAGDYEIAKDIYDQALLICQEGNLEHTLFYAKLLMDTGSLYQLLGNYKIAKGLMANGMAIMLSLNLNNSFDYAEAVMTYANLQKDLGVFDEALSNTLKAKKMFRQFLNDDDIRYADLNNLLGQIYFNNGNYRESLELYEKSVKLFQDKGLEDNVGIGYAYNGLGMAYQSLGDYNKALKHYQLGSKILGEKLTKKHKDYGITLMNLGTVYGLLNNYSSAYFCYTEAVEVISQSIGVENSLYGQLCIGLLGVVYKDQSIEVSESKELVDRALSIFKNNTDESNLYYNYALMYKAIIAKEENDLDSAISYLLEAEKRIAKHLEGESQIYYDVICHLSMFYDMNGQHELAISYYKKYNDYLLNSLVKVFAFRSQEDKKIFLRNSEFWFSFMTSVSRKEKFQSKELVSIAFNNQLIRKGLLLNSSKGILISLEEINDEVISNKIKTYRTLKGNLASLRSHPVANNGVNVNDISKKIIALETELVELYSANFGSNTGFEKNWKDIKSVLNDSEIAVEFISYYPSFNDQEKNNVKYLAYIISNSDSEPMVVELFNETELKQKIINSNPNQLYAARGSKAKSTTFTNNVYELVWKPLEEYLKEVKTIYYSPVGLLNQVPFAALNKNGELLSSKYELVQLSSTSLLAESTEEPRLDHSLFIGGINYDFKPNGEKIKSKANNFDFLKSSRGNREFGETWNYLPGTMTEIQSVQKLFKKKKKKYSSISKSGASEEAFKNLSGNSPSILHIATHGFFFEGQPKENRELLELSKQSPYRVSEDPLMRSGLILAGANYAWKHGNNPYEEEDGVLMAAEIANLDLSKTDMVVLSACNTGLGDIDGSEGVYGLQRAFKMAGVDIIVMSLWEVPDKETAEFMKLFYSNWLTGMKVRDAFNKTQRSMSKKYKDSPEKWAAFVLFE
ncbi:CHAT domain-containing protein [Seonamhaeicola sp. MEBiC1930]|uniref:CHAT domain-containing protein n=1 Tax=Seonamhaeicola sp. MEBiC01930 TaxID=2976768 RepID=UPI0032544E2B